MWVSASAAQGSYGETAFAGSLVYLTDSACLAVASLSSEVSARRRLVGLSRFELLTPRLSSVCSNQLSYRPKPTLEPTASVKEPVEPILSKLDRTCVAPSVSVTRG